MDVLQAEKEPEHPCRAVVTVISTHCSYRSCFDSKTLLGMEQGCIWMCQGGGMSFQTSSSSESSSSILTN